MAPVQDVGLASDSRQGGVWRARLRHAFDTIRGNLRGPIRLSAEGFAVLAILTAGVWLVGAVPIGAGNDEETHILRLWDLAHFEWLPNEQGDARNLFPAVYWKLSFRRRAIVEPVPAGFFSEHLDDPIDEDGYIYQEIPTRSTYAPLTMLPQALAMRYLGLKFGVAALPAFYGSRLVGLLVYAILVWAAIRLAPWGKWVLAMVASLPMAVFQASTINPDAVSNGVGLVFVAGVLCLSKRAALGKRGMAVLALLFAALFAVKPHLAALAALPFLLIRADSYGSVWRRVHVAVLAIVLFGIEIGGWTLIALERNPLKVPGVDAAAQLVGLLGRPWLFGAVAARDAFAHLGDYFVGILGEYGNGYWAAPPLIYVLSLMALVASVHVDASPTSPSRRERVAFATVFGGGYLLTLLALYLTYTPVGKGTVDGVNGRYLLPYLPLLLVAVMPAATEVPSGRERNGAMILAACSLLAYSMGAYASYYVTCGTQYYIPGLCYRPIYKNWAPDALYSPPPSGQGLIQQLVPSCNYMEEMRVWVGGSDPGPAGQTGFIVRDPSGDRDVAVRWVQNRDLPRGDWLTLTFPVEEGSAGHLYLLKVLDDGSEESSPARVGLTLEPEYRSGDLYVDSQKSDLDMVFQYGCRVGLEWVARGLADSLGD